MYFTGETQIPTQFLAAPDTRDWWQRGRDNRKAMGDLLDASARVQRFSESFNSDEQAQTEAYDQRIAAVQEATGVKMENPYRTAIQVGGLPDFGAWSRDPYQKAKDDFSLQLTELQRLKPDKADVIRAHVPIAQDAFQLSQQAKNDLEAARAEARKTGLTDNNQFITEMAGGTKEFVRDPPQLYAALFGGLEAKFLKTIGGRILFRAATDGAINGGVELAVQVKADQWRKRAGIQGESLWKQVGMAAAFGGGLGGLMEGAGHVLTAKGRATPETDAALARMAKGDVAVQDVHAVADALGVKLDDAETSALRHAAESDADTAAVVRPETPLPEVKQAVRAIEDGSPMPAPHDIMEGGHVPPSLKRKTQQTGGQIPDNAISENMPGIMPENIAQEPTGHMRDDPAFKSFVAEQDAARIAKLQDAVAMNEADIAHLRDDGSLDNVPSERDFTGVRAASDDQRVSIVLAELEAKVGRMNAEIAQGPKYHPDDAAMQVAYAKQFGQRTVAQPELKHTKLATPAAPEAVQAAAQKLELAGGVKPQILNHGTPEALSEMVPRDTLDIMDALPGGTDAMGNAVATTHAEMTDFATRMSDMANLIASCKA